MSKPDITRGHDLRIPTGPTGQEEVAVKPTGSLEGEASSIDLPPVSREPGTLPGSKAPARPPGLPTRGAPRVTAASQPKLDKAAPAGEAPSEIKEFVPQEAASRDDEKADKETPLSVRPTGRQRRTTATSAAVPPDGGSRSATTHEHRAKEAQPTGIAPVVESNNTAYSLFAAPTIAPSDQIQTLPPQRESADTAYDISAASPNAARPDEPIQTRQGDAPRPDATFHVVKADAGATPAAAETGVKDPAEFAGFAASIDESLAEANPSNKDLRFSAIRESGGGFVGEEKRYREHIDSSPELPQGAEFLRHQIPWPIDMSDPKVHIATYYQDTHHAAPDDPELHTGVDIQAPIGTEIIAPEDLQVISVFDEDQVSNGLATVVLFSPTTRLSYILGHLDRNSIPEELFRQYTYNSYVPALNSETFVESGQVLGTVGLFYNDARAKYGLTGIEPRVELPKDVEAEYGRSFNHLHIDIAFHPNNPSFPNGSLANVFTYNGRVNPISFLQPLYPLGVYETETRTADGPVETSMPAEQTDPYEKVGLVKEMIGGHEVYSLDTSDENAREKLAQLKELIKDKRVAAEVGPGNQLDSMLFAAKYAQADIVIGIDPFFDSSQMQATQTESDQQPTVILLKGDAWGNRLIHDFFGADSDDPSTRLAIYAQMVAPDTEMAERMIGSTRVLSRDGAMIVLDSGAVEKMGSQHYPEHAIERKLLEERGFTDPTVLDWVKFINQKYQQTEIDAEEYQQGMQDGKFPQTRFLRAGQMLILHKDVTTAMEAPVEVSETIVVDSPATNRTPVIEPGFIAAWEKSQAAIKNQVKMYPSPDGLIRAEDTWADFYNSDISDYEKTFAGVLRQQMAAHLPHGELPQVQQNESIVNLIHGIQGALVVDLLAPSGTLASMFEKLPEDPDRIGVAVSNTDQRREEELTRDERLGIDQLPGDITTSKTLRELEAKFDGRKVNLFVERGNGALWDLPAHPQYFRYMGQWMWNNLSPDNGIMLIELPPDRVFISKGVQIPNWTEILDYSGVEYYTDTSSSGKRTLLAVKTSDKPLEFPQERAGYLRRLDHEEAVVQDPTTPEAPQSRLEEVPSPRTGIYKKLIQPSYPYSQAGETTGEAIEGGGFMDILDVPFGSGGLVNAESCIYQLEKAISLSAHPEIDSILERGGPEMIQKLRDAQVLSGMKILDLGSGPFPYFALVAKSLGAEVHTVDNKELDEDLPFQLESHTVVDLNSPDAVEQIRKNSGGNFTFVTANNVLPLRGEPLDYLDPKKLRPIGEELLLDGGYYFGFSDRLYQKKSTTSEAKSSMSAAEKRAREFGLTPVRYPGVVDKVSRFFDVELPEEPTFVIYTPVVQGLLRRLNKQGEKFPLLSGPLSGATYDDRHNIIFLHQDDKDDPVPIHHEPGHAILHYLRPDLIDHRNQFSEVLYAYLDGKVGSVDLPVENFTVATIISEGVPTLGEFECSPQTQEILARKSNLFTREGVAESSDPSFIDEAWIQTNFDRLADGTRNIQRLLSEQSHDVAQFEYQLREIDSVAPYVVGLYFFNGVMEQLRRNGITEAELPQTMRNIIEEHLPTSLDEFRDPVAYVQQLKIKLEGHKSQIGQQPSAEPKILTVPARNATAATDSNEMLEGKTGDGDQETPWGYQTTNEPGTVYTTARIGIGFPELIAQILPSTDARTGAQEIAQDPVYEAVRRAERLGFRTKDNSTDVETVEKVFGHTFSERPALVILTEDNARILKEQRRRGEDFNFDPPKDLESYKAVHDPNHNITFLTETAYQHGPTRTHEIVHSLIDEINPELTGVRQRFIRAQAVHTNAHSVLGIEEQMPEDADPEKAVIAYMMHEGFAKWGSYEAVPFHIDHVRDQNAFLYGDAVLGSRAEVTIDRDWIERNMRKLEDSVALYQYAFQQTEIRDILATQRQADSSKKVAQYVVGMYFAHVAAEHLRREGVTDEVLAQRMKELIANPPQTLDEFRDPVAYLQQLQTKLAAQEGDSGVDAVEPVVVLENMISSGFLSDEAQGTTRPAASVPQSPQDVVVDWETLERQRFVIHPDSMEGLVKLAGGFNELKRHFKYLKGLGFIGSRTKGTEYAATDAHDGSDYDFFIFYNSSEFTDETPGGTTEWSSIIRYLENQLGQGITVDKKTLGLRVNLNVWNAEEDLYVLTELASPYIQDSSQNPPPKSLEHRSVINLMSRFLLSVGEEVYESRKYILDRLEQLPDGEAYFGFLMQALAHFERHPSKIKTPQYNHLPQTIAEAKIYFLPDRSEEKQALETEAGGNIAEVVTEILQHRQPTDWAENALYPLYDAPNALLIPHFEAVDPNAPIQTQRDRYGNRLITSPTMAYKDRQGNETKAAMLVSKEGEDFIKANPGILHDIDHGIQILNEAVQSGFDWASIDDVDLGEGRKMSILPNGNTGQQSLVFQLEVGNEKYTIRKHQQRNIASNGITQPYINDMLQTQAIALDLSKELASAGIKMPTHLFASGQMSCIKYVEGTYPAQGKVHRKMQILLRTVKKYIKTQKSNLWEYIHIDTRYDNFIQEDEDGDLVWIDRLYYSPLRSASYNTTSSENFESLEAGSSIGAAENERNDGPYGQSEIQESGADGAETNIVNPVRLLESTRFVLHPTLTKEQQQILEQNRFVITPESREGMRRLQTTFEEIETDYPHLRGLGFFGSRKTGTELQATEGDMEQQASDFDVVVYYDPTKAASEEAAMLLDTIEHWDKVVDTLNASLNGFHVDGKLKGYLGELRIDISEENTREELRVFTRKASFFLDSDISEKKFPQKLDSPQMRKLVRRFFLTNNEDVIANRRFILNQLRQDTVNGEKYFQILMTALSKTERNSLRVPLPLYQGFPQTIDEAEKYFVTDRRDEKRAFKEMEPSYMLNEAFTPLVAAFRDKVQESGWLDRESTRAIDEDALTIPYIRPGIYRPKKYTDFPDIFAYCRNWVTTREHFHLLRSKGSLNDLQFYAPVGQYGEEWAKKLVSAGMKLAEAVYYEESDINMRDEANEVGKAYKDTLRRYTYRKDSYSEGSGPIETLAENFQSIQLAAGYLTMYKVSGYKDPEKLLQDLSEQGVLSQLSLLIPPEMNVTLGKARHVFAKPIIEKDAHGKFRLRQDVIDYFMEHRDDEPKSATGREPLDKSGCPGGRKLRGYSKSSVDMSAKLFTETVGIQGKTEQIENSGIVVFEAQADTEASSLRIEAVGEKLSVALPRLHREFFAAMLQGKLFIPTSEQITTAVEEHFAYAPLTLLTQELEESLRADMQELYEYYFSMSQWKQLAGEVVLQPREGKDHLYTGQEARKLIEQSGARALTPQEKEELLTNPAFYTYIGLTGDSEDGGGTTTGRLLSNGTRHLTREHHGGTRYADGKIGYSSYGFTIADITHMLDHVRQTQGKGKNEKLYGLDVGGSNGLGAYDAEEIDPNLDMTNITIDPEVALWPLRGEHKFLQAERFPEEMAEKYDIIFSNIAIRSMRQRDIALENMLKALRVGGIMNIHFSADFEPKSGQTDEQINTEIITQFQRLSILEKQGLIKFLPVESQEDSLEETWRKQRNIVIHLQKIGSVDNTVSIDSFKYTPPQI